ncbi:GNAT family N-acetyltransferase [Acidisoma sp. 7E03]
MDETAPPVIDTERLHLRRMTEADVPALHAIMRDPAVMRFWSSLPHAREADTAAFVASTIAAVAAGESDDFVITRDGRVIGKAGLWRGGEIGFLLARDQWGQGIAAEALRAVIARAFARGATEITADVDPSNAACLRLLTRLGFHETGRAARTFLIGETWVDSVYLALAAP